MIEHYTYRVSWSPEDEEFVGSVLEMPSLSWLAETSTEALQGIQNLVAEVAADMQSQGEPLPPALADRTYSGKISLRLSPDLHRRATIEAQEQGISLNRYLVTKISA